MSSMVFDWNQYLELARELEGRRDESALRSAASRAYYSVFCQARNWLEARGWTRPPVDVHASVWREFRNSGDFKRKQIGIDGTRLKRMRVMADYFDTLLNPSSHARDAVIKATGVLALLRGLP